MNNNEKSRVNILSLYQLMLANMGPQHWWPADSKPEIILGAILVQNTNWQNVDKSLINLKKATYFKPDKILSLPKAELETLIKPSGFYKNKAHSINSTFSFFQKYNWDYTKIYTVFGKDLRKILLNLHGIGPETADVLLLFIFDQPVFIADNYARVLFNYLEDSNYPTYQKLKRAVELPENFTYKDAQELHGLIDEFGKSNLKNSTKFKQSFLGKSKSKVLK